MNEEVSSVKKTLKDIVYRGCTLYHGSAIVKVGNNTYYGRMVQELGGK